MRAALFLLLCSFPLAIRTAEPACPVVLENPHFRYVIGADAQNVAFIDRASGTDYRRAGTPSPCARVRTQGREVPATAARLAGDRLELEFHEAALTAVLRVDVRSYAIVLTVDALRGEAPESLTFVQVPLALKGRPDEPFGACALSLNLHTRVDALPALQSELRASCERLFGQLGARVALVAAPLPELLPALRDTLATASELPVCQVAGPWADGVPFNHGSYLFNFGSLTETNVDDWIDMAHSLGFTQIDNHGGGEFFRFGDFELNRQKWPEGWATYERIVARLHAAGIGSIFHTYAFFIDKRSRYVTPVPDPRLDAFRTFTLAEPVTAEAAELMVKESTAGLSTVTGFFEHNSVVLQVGDELLTFAGVSAAPPWRFTGLKRGALGTRAAAHSAGTSARHLKECFGLFVPNPESSLFEEIAAGHAEVVNRCGFDGLYLDAIDGSSILRGGDASWYWADKFVVEIQKRLQRPVGMEMSAMWHHCWQYRTRWQAWDYPQRGQLRFLDQHAAEVNGGLLLPLHLGWWNFQAYDPPQIEPSYPELIETLGARLIGWDAGISLTGGIDRQALRQTPLYRRAVDILRQCEELRHAKAFDAATRAKLRAPGSEFALVRDADGRPRFRPRQSQSQTLVLAEPWTLAWTITNRFAEQPACFRIESLASAGGRDDTNSVDLTQPGLADTAWVRATAPGVQCAVEPGASQASPVAWLVATNSGTRAPTAAWARFQRRLSPTVNLAAQRGLALEVEGDGSGALLAIRLESPQHLAFGALADRYLPLDFVGRREVRLVETESTRWSDYTWDDGKGLYNAYRETIHFDAIESVSIWLQNLPPGRAVRCGVGAVRAVPLASGTLRHPTLVIAGRKLEFPVDLTSGSWIEARGPGDCQVYGPKGESLGAVTPRGDWPNLGAETSVTFESAPGSGPVPRARVTWFGFGDNL